MGSFRRTFAILATFSVSAVILFLSYSGEQIRSQIIKPLQLKLLVEKHGYLLDTSGCRIPEWDPYDPSVLPFIQKLSSPYTCTGKPPFLMGKFNATVIMDEHILNYYYGLEKTNVSCAYRPIKRDPGPEDQRTDNKFTFGESKPLELDIPLEDEFIEIMCEMGNLPPFTQYMALVPLKQEVENRTSKIQPPISNEENLSVIIVGIDSISKLNFLRHFEKTLNFITKYQSPIELKGYTKVADNTFPNLVPFLTGHFIDYYWNESMRNMFFDHLDFIWKNFSAKGYRTLFAEDAPNIATFNYLKKGFKSPPSDYYFRPFALAVEKSRMKQLSRNHCFQSELEIEVLYRYLQDFLITMGQRPLFAFTFVARLTHDKLNSAGYADEPTVKLLRKLHDYGALNRSLVILFSDHGIRFGPIRQTYIGKFEERMPFIYMLFPTWFHQKYPEYAKNLRLNQERLTTPFDIHATLAHLVNLGNSQPGNETNPVTDNYGISLFKEIPENRTCAQAGILPHWCPCQIHEKISISDPIVMSAAEAIVNTINEWLEPFREFCSKLKLEVILDARLGQANEVVLRFVKHMNDVINRQVVLGDKTNAPMDYLLTVRTTPNGGIFEGTVRYDEVEGTFKVLDDISRINMYGNQSSCIHNSQIRKFCYCTVLPPTTKVTEATLSTVKNVSATI